MHPYHSHSTNIVATLLANAMTVVMATVMAFAVPSSAQARDAATPEPGDEQAAIALASGLMLPGPAEQRTIGEGPFESLILRGVILIDGTGAPPVGPVDIHITRDRIRRIAPHTSAEDGSAAGSSPDSLEIDATGMYVLPGFIDAHSHLSTPGQSVAGTPAPADYVYRLLLAHGITTVREVGSLNGLSWVLDEKRKSLANLSAAPRIYAYALLLPEYFDDHDQLDRRNQAVHRWVADVKRRGADGLKLYRLPREIAGTLFDAANRHDLRTAFHHSQLSVTQMNVLTSARLGLISAEHWYGIPEAMFTQQTIQNYPVDYNYTNEQHRFAEAGRLWAQAAAPDSERSHALIRELIELDVTLVPTLNVYEATRDTMRARTAEWHDEYTWPSLWRFFQPNPLAHGSFFFNWTTSDEIAWRRNFQLWMQFLAKYLRAGGRIAAGSDAGYIFATYGFAYIRELELLAEAGLNPLEIVRAATLSGAEVLGAERDLGSVEPGKLADLVVVADNPLRDFKVLYGTGAVRLDRETRAVVRRQSIRWTIKGGVVFDAPALLADVRKRVADEKQRELSESQR